MVEPEIDTQFTQPAVTEAASAVDPSDTNESIRESIEEIWYLKEISFRPTPESESRPYKIITQNQNGQVTCLLRSSIWADTCALSISDLALSLPSVRSEADSAVRSSNI